MNKGRRTEKTKLKHLKRLKRLGLPAGSHYCYKAQAKPCSCFVCSPEKYSRKTKHKDAEEYSGFRFLSKEEVEARRCNAYSYIT